MLAEAGAERVGRVQVYLPAQQGRQLVLNGEEGKAGRLPRLELHKHIHVAVGAKRRRKHGAKKGQLANVMTPAEIRQQFLKCRLAVYRQVVQIYFCHDVHPCLSS